MGVCDRKGFGSELENAKILIDIKENLYFYYKNPEGTTKSKFSLKRIDYIWALSEQIKFYQKIKWNLMKSAVVEKYLISAVYYANLIEAELQDYKAARNLRKSAARVYMRYRKSIQRADHKSYFYEELFPLMYKVRLRLLGK